MFVVKECSKCKEYKLLEEFFKGKKHTFGFHSWCKLCAKEHRQVNRERQKEYYQANRKEYHKEYYQANRERIKKVNKEYRQANRERIKEYRKEYENNRKSTDAMFKFKHAISHCIRMSIKGKGFTKKSKAHEILGCDYETFKLHIERQFNKGMTWDNHGEWHLDHIYPVSLAKDEQHLIELNHYTNFQPLWAKDNLSKSNNIIEPIQMRLTI